MKRLLLTALIAFSSPALAQGSSQPPEDNAESELKFPDYSPLGQRIANGDSVKAKVFYWIDADGTISSTKEGWRKVPKSSRNLVYLDKNKAERAVLYASKSPEEIAQLEKQRGKEETKFVEEVPSLRPTEVGKRKGGKFYWVSSGHKYRGESYRYEHYSTDRIVRYHGQGTFTWRDKNNYVGNFKNGEIHGNGTFNWASGSKYVGEWKYGNIYGNGTYTWAGGHKYVGQWWGNQRVGYGTTTYADGTIEEGFWINDKLTALTGPACTGSYSAFTWHNCIGRRGIDITERYNTSTLKGPNPFYTHFGWYQNGKANGQGFLISAPQALENWKHAYDYIKDLTFHDIREGFYNTFAVQDFKDYRGDYEGTFKNGKPHGQGTYIYSDGAQYSGESRKGELHGQGTFTWPDGSKYVGEWKDGEEHGQGTYTQVGDHKYVGKWKDGKQHGQGTKTYNDGTIEEGEYDNNRFVKGTRLFSDGNKYVGEFRYNKYDESLESIVEGVGNFYRTDGTMMGGLWKNNEPVDIYSGYECSGDFALWSDCIGTLTLIDGTQFIGKFLDGKTSGKGTLIFSDSSMQFAAVPPEQEQVISNYKGPSIGDTVKTKYFEITVNSINFQNRVGNFNFPVYPGQGNKFLVIDITYVNSDNEARTLRSGDVVVRADDKEFLFDTAEIVFADRYIAFDKLNPMVTRKGYIVFKVPEGLKGKVFYKPASSSELIYLK